MIKIEQLKLAENPKHKELSALVDGTDVWFRFPAWVPITGRAEIFLPLALAEAMVRAEDVMVDDGVVISEKLAGTLPEIVKVFCSWNQDDNHPIKVQAATGPTGQHSESVICCFSGGIDSSFSFSQHQSEITDLLVVMGFDASGAGPQWLRLIDRLQQFADKMGKRLISVETNLREVIESRNLSWDAAHGSILAAIGVALQARTIIIPSSFDYGDLFPWGSHPLLDPLWSTESTIVLHHGSGFSRTQKTEQLLQHPYLLDELQVCWNHVDKNCGQCSKCLRTLVALYMLKAKSTSLPTYDGTSSLLKMKPGSLSSVPFVDDLIRLAKRTNHRHIARTLIRDRNRFLLKYHLIETIRAMLGNRGRKLSWVFAKKSWHSGRTKIKGGQVTLE